MIYVDYKAIYSNSPFQEDILKDQFWDILK
jgi:hypothetical protein